VQFCVICKRISCTAVVGKCLNFHISFTLFLFRMFIVAIMKNLSVDEVRQVYMRYSQLYTVPPCLSGAEGCETTDRRGRIGDAVFPLFSMEGKMTSAEQLLIMDVTVFAFISRTIRYAEYIHTKDESCLSDLRRFTKRF
jgi:hypothetical protein